MSGLLAWLRARLSSEQEVIPTANDIDRAAAAGIEHVRFRFGHMLAGHCSYSRRMDGRHVPIDQAEPLPAKSCEHPDQCGCRWQSWIPLMDELGI